MQNLKSHALIVGFICTVLIFVGIVLVLMHKHHVVAARKAAASRDSVTSTASLETVPGDASLAKIPILVYHSIMPQNPLKPETRMQKHYRIDPAVFAEQLEYLKKNGYQPITFNTLAEAMINKTALPKKSVVITFDDGWENQYTYALPVLRQDKFPATFFIITSYADRKYAAYMTWDQIVALDKAGMEVASHSVDHPNLTTLPLQKVQEEISQSKTVLEQKIGHTITTFAYPYYAQNQAVQAAIASAGYVAARAGWVGTQNSLNTIYALKSQEVINNPNPFAQ